MQIMDTMPYSPSLICDILSLWIQNVDMCDYIKCFLLTQHEQGKCEGSWGYCITYSEYKINSLALTIRGRLLEKKTMLMQS